MVEVFGIEHIIFLIIYLIAGCSLLVVAKLKIKAEKIELLYFRFLSILIIISDLLCRIGEGIQYGWINALPTSICSVTGFVLPFIILFGKKNLGVYQALTYMGILGGIFALILAPFISQGSSIFQLNTFMALLYHGLLLILCISMILFNWFRPSLKKSYYFIIVYSLYITFGTFEMCVLGSYDAMSIKFPLVDNTPINCWFILLIGTILIYLVAFIYESIVKLINKKKQSKEGSEL